jgi:hypothetical protein
MSKNLSLHGEEINQAERLFVIEPSNQCQRNVRELKSRPKTSNAEEAEGTEEVRGDW